MNLLRRSLIAAVCCVAIASPLRAQEPALSTLRVQVTHDGTPLERAVVRAAGVRRVTDTAGTVVLILPSGPHTLLVSRIGYLPDTTHMVLRPGIDTSVVVDLQPRGAELEEIVVTTRSQRRIEDTPLRVEVVDEEEIAEKTAMTPGDVAMLLNETSGLRVQTTSPSLSGAGVRIQGLRGRYTLLLADGLPLHGAQAGALGLLQIPPMDLARVEVIKGTASALYGGGALGGVVNFISRRPHETVGELLLNRTSLDGSDAVLFVGAPLNTAATLGATLLAGLHVQDVNDLDDDGWADIPEYDRVVIRPRIFFENEQGRSFFGTIGYTRETREGGTLPGRVTLVGDPFVEGLRTRRSDAGLTALLPLRGSASLNLRASATDQSHVHRIGSALEDDSHRTAFAEASVRSAIAFGTLVAGAAAQAERYSNDAVPQFGYSHRVASAFAQLDADVTEEIVVSTSGRLDDHSVYGVLFSPRASILLRAREGVRAGWSARLSAGGGTFAPTPFTEETEATGLSALVSFPQLLPERAVGASMDIGGPLATPIGPAEVNFTVFGSRLRNTVATRDAAGTSPNGGPLLELVNAPLPTKTWGAEVLLRLVRGPFRATGTYAWTRATEWDGDAVGGARRAVPLIPRHAAGVVASLEQEGVSRLALELYYTGRQSLEDNPYRETSRPYLVFGALAEHAFAIWSGHARVFVNAENLLDVRQTRVDPLLLPQPGSGGRRTTDVWSLLEGRSLNAGIRFSL